MILRSCLLSLLVCVVSAHAQESVIAPAMAQVTDTMRSLVEDEKVAGSVAIVSHRGQIVYFDAVGKRDIDADLPMEKDTIVRIYSMTKPITSVAAMMLVEAGKLGLDDPVSKYLPEFNDLKVYAGKENGQDQLEAPESRMVVRDLLRHTSGLTYGFFGNTEIDKRYRAANVIGRATSLAEMTTKLGKIPLLYPPGTRFNYSVSSDVLGRVVEVASGEKLDDFLAEQIFRPLGMVDTSFCVPAAKRNRLAATHGYKLQGGLRVTDAPATSQFCNPPGLCSGGGGLVSTASDYMRFCQMLLNEGELDGKRLLSAQTVAEMTRDQLPKQAYPISMGGTRRSGVGFGLGFSVIVEKTDYTKLNRLGEYGWGGAASTHFWISPADDLAVVVLTQLQPYTAQMEIALKPVIYSAIEGDK